MNNSKFRLISLLIPGLSTTNKQQKLLAPGFIFLLMLVIYLILHAQPALAHHATGGKTPANFFEGFLSGLAHPIIGLDHFAFVIAVGLFAALQNSKGISIPVVFVLTTVFGTVIHLFRIDLPLPELIISASVVGAGLILARENKTNLVILIAVAALAGMFHGYAYGESIVGAEMTPLGAYLCGFSLIQILVSAIAFYGGKLTLTTIPKQPNLYLRFAGFVCCGIGLTFLSTAILG